MMKRREPPPVRNGKSFVAGNIASATTQISESAHLRKLKGLRSSMIVKRKIYEGEQVVTKETPQFRKRLKERVAAEAREVQERARSLAMEAMEELGEMVTDKRVNGAVRIAAINTIFDRAYGKPNQTNTNLNVDANGKSDDVSQAELLQRVAETLKRVEAITGGAAEEAKGEEGSADLRERDRNPDGSSLH